MAIELSSTEKEKSSWIVSLVSVLSILIFLVAAGIFAYFYFVVAKQQDQQISQIEAAIAKQKTTSGYSENDLTKIGKEVNDYKTLMLARSKVSSFFPALEQWIHPQVYFTSFSLDASTRTVTLSGVASNFQPLIQQIAILKNQPLIERYEVSNISMAETGGVTFSLSLTVNSQVLK
jgi:Tfp pilus assembly protein PilN